MIFTNLAASTDGRLPENNVDPRPSRVNVNDRVVSARLRCASNRASSDSREISGCSGATCASTCSRMAASLSAGLVAARSSSNRSACWRCPSLRSVGNSPSTLWMLRACRTPMVPANAASRTWGCAVRSRPEKTAAFASFVDVCPDSASHVDSGVPFTARDEPASSASATSTLSSASTRVANVRAAATRSSRA